MRNVTLICSLISALTAMGCMQERGPDLSHALPRGEDVRVKLPDSAAMQVSESPGEIGSTQLAELGQLADYYVVTRNVTRDLNFSVGWVLTLVHVVVQFPPTTIDVNDDGETVYTWGPHSKALEPSEWMLIVTEHEADADYSWQLDGRDKTTDGSIFHTMISGRAYPGDEPHRGHGSFMIDFDAAQLANPVDNQGKRGAVSVEYDLENRDDTPATIAMIVDGYELDESGFDQPVHWEYDYAENLDSSGDFRFAVHGNLDGESAFEDAQISSEWIATGEGRATVSVSGGDLGDLVVEATECWDTSFRRVYYADSMDWAPTEGEEASCAM